MNLFRSSSGCDIFVCFCLIRAILNLTSQFFTAAQIVIRPGNNATVLSRARMGSSSRPESCRKGKACRRETSFEGMQCPAKTLGFEPQIRDIVFLCCSSLVVCS